MPRTKHKPPSRANKPPPPREPRRGKSPQEFCDSYGISRSTYEQWQRDGVGPVVLQPGGPGTRVIITEIAEREWLAKATSLAAAVADSAAE
jgi:hypothetical protein